MEEPGKAARKPEAAVVPPKEEPMKKEKGTLLFVMSAGFVPLLVVP